MCNDGIGITGLPAPMGKLQCPPELLTPSILKKKMSKNDCRKYKLKCSTQTMRNKIGQTYFLIKSIFSQKSKSTDSLFLPCSVSLCINITLHYHRKNQITFSTKETWYCTNQVMDKKKKMHKQFLKITFKPYQDCNKVYMSDTAGNLL